MLQHPNHRWSMTRVPKTSCEKLTTPLWPATSAEEAVDFRPIPRELEWETETEWKLHPVTVQGAGLRLLEKQVSRNKWLIMMKSVCIALRSTCGHKLVKLSTYCRGRKQPSLQNLQGRLAQGQHILQLVHVHIFLCMNCLQRSLDDSPKAWCSLHWALYQGSIWNSSYKMSTLYLSINSHYSE